MAFANYRVTIENLDYNNTVYTVWVQATSKNQAIVLAAARAGGEMVAREHARMPSRGVNSADAMMNAPEVRIEPVDLDEYWAHENEIEVADYHTRH